MRYLALVVFIVIFTSCRSSKKNELPAGLVADSILPETEMINVLADVHILEAALQAKSSKGTDIENMKRFYYPKLFSKYRISESRFRKNLEYYEEDPEHFSKMYENVVEQIEKREKPVEPE
jgi:hypothetical protein